MPRKILYSDDDEGLRTLGKRGLGRDGSEGVGEPSGERGLAALTAKPDIDVVALDLYMPGLSGIETLERINAIENHPPGVVVTGAQDSRMAVSALKAGAFDYVVKDVQGEFLFFLKAALSGAVSSMRMRRAKEAAEAEVREARDRFEALAAERALLMREVNHRVGNSLQMIASMLTLHANAAGNPEVSEALTDATGRVLAVAQVHRRLYTSDDVQSVAVDQYLAALVEDLRRSSETNELAQLSLPSEPVMNALKYAYPESKGPIRVDIRETGDNRAALIVEDDGVGIVPRAKPKSTGLGQRIVRAMGEKLNAEIEVDRAPKGTRVVVSFDLRKSPPPAAAATRPAA